MDKKEASVAAPGRVSIRSRAGFVISSLSAGHGVFHWFNQSFLVVLPEIKRTFGLSNVQVGAITATREMTSGLITLPGGVFTDRFRRYWGAIMAACVGLLGLGWLTLGLAPVYGFLLVGIAIVAISASLWHLPAAASLSLRFPQKRGTALSIHGIGGNIGDVLGPVATGALLGVLTWQRIIAAYAVVPLLLVFVVLWAFRDIGGTRDEAAPPKDMKGQLQLTKAVLKDPLLWGISLVSGLRSMATVPVTTFLPIYMRDDLGLSPERVGVYFGLLVAVGILTTPLLGYLSDRIGRKKVMVPSQACLALFCLALVAFGQGWTLPVVIFCIGIFLRGDQPILTAAMLDAVGKNVANTALGALSLFRFALSASSPVIAGVLYEAHGIDSVFYYAAGVFCLSVLVLLFVRLKKVDG